MTHTCPKCEYTFRTLVDLIAHMKVCNTHKENPMTTKKTYDVIIDLNSLTYTVEAENKQEAVANAVALLNKHYPNCDLTSTINAFVDYEHPTTNKENNQ